MKKNIGKNLGVCVVAYTRRSLFEIKQEFGDDFVYIDTDSIKVSNAENHINYIENYNNINKSLEVKELFI